MSQDIVCFNFYTNNMALPLGKQAFNDQQNVIGYLSY